MRFLFLILLSLVHVSVQCQEHNAYRIRTMAFYNVENLFDTERDTLIFDQDRTPEGRDKWTLERYQLKLANLSKVLMDIGYDETAPDIVGLCEIENNQVLEDLVNHKNLQDQDYGIVHFDSPDLRGIDVALLYKKSAFMPTSYNSHQLLLVNLEDERKYTRDQLVVGGLLDDEQLYFIVNHWPSRSGGEARSQPNRIAAAQLNKKIIDSLLLLEANAKIISMGDFNDDPTNDSFKKVLKTKGEIHRLEEKDLYNPMEKLYRKGLGSLAFRDKWSLFDQFFFTANLIDPERKTYSYWKAGIFNPIYLIDPRGRFKGYPLRTYAGGSYVGGYSDHFPVFLHLIKKVD